MALKLFLVVLWVGIKVLLGNDVVNLGERLFVYKNTTRLFELELQGMVHVGHQLENLLAYPNYYGPTLRHSPSKIRKPVIIKYV